MVIVADSSRMCSCDSHCLKLIGIIRYFVPQNLVRYLRHHACQTGRVLDSWILFFILIVSRGVIQKALNGHAHSSLPWLFVARKKITSWRRQKLWKPSEHWGGAIINQFASDLTPYIWKYQAELSRGLVQLWSHRLKSMRPCGDQQVQKHSNNFAQECLPKMLPCRVECLVGLTSATSLQPSSTDHCVYDGPRHKSFQSKWRVAVM